MPYKLVASGDKFFVVSPHGQYLSNHPLTKDAAQKQQTAVRLTELRKENPHYAPGLQHAANEDHVHKVSEEGQTGRLDAMGLPFVPAPRDAVHKHGIIKTSDIFAPLPLPTHHLR
jgi:hypothetical protein